MIRKRASFVLSSVTNIDTRKILRYIEVAQKSAMLNPIAIMFESLAFFSIFVLFLAVFHA